MCFASIKWLNGWVFLVGCLACSSTEKVSGLDDRCRTRLQRLHPGRVHVLVTYPWCSACMEQVSAFFASDAGAGLKPVYLVRSAMRETSPCAQSQVIIRSARALFQGTEPMLVLTDTLIARPHKNGLHIGYGGSWLVHDSLFQGMQLDTARLRLWLMQAKGKREK
jgi:hypothetical protein